MGQDEHTKPPSDTSIIIEINQLRDRVEEQFREREVIERGFKALAQQLGVRSDIVRIEDPLPPLNKHQVSPPAIVDDGEPLQPTEPCEINETWWPTGDDQRVALVPSPGWGCYSLRHKVNKVLGISVCGLSRENLARTIEMISRRQRNSRDFLPIFLTDSTDFDLFRANNYVFEYLPPQNKRSHLRSREAWSEYAAMRLRFLTEKWNIAQVIQFGPKPFDE